MKRFRLVLIALTMLLLYCTSAQAASYPTVYNGVDYKKVYNYNYYVDRYPDVKQACGTDKTAALKHFATKGIAEGRYGSSYCLKSGGRALCREIIYQTMMTPEEAELSRLLFQTKTVKKTTQLILIVGHKMTFWEKIGWGVMKKRFSSYCGYGRNGFSSDRHEGDGTTPMGAFGIVYAFGNAADPGAKMKYRRTTSKSWLSSEKSTYNQWVESSRSMSGEHLRSISCYKYAMWIDFNTKPVVYGKGSAIFLHCKSSKWSTSGCVSVNESVMKKIIKTSKTGIRMIIVPKKSMITNY